MPKLEVVIDEKYFVVTDTNTPQEYKTLELASQANGWKCIIIRQKGYTDPSKKEQPVYDFEFVNRGRSIREKEINVGSWVSILEGIWDAEKEQYLKARFKFCSPEGMLRRIPTLTGRGITSIIQTVEKLTELSQFKSWQEYDLFMENRRLKSEVESLKLKIAELENK